MIRFLVAMEREADAFGVPCEIIGIGGTNIPEIEETDIIVNVGYCGATGMRPGTIVEPCISVDLSDDSVVELEKHFEVQRAVCYTSDEFVTEPVTEEAAVYDMELSKLAKMKCAGLYVLKIVSDNLNEKDCEAFNSERSWERVRTILKGIVLM